MSDLGEPMEIFVIEEVDGSQIPENELMEFEETNPVLMDQIPSTSSTDPVTVVQHIDDEALIRKFVNGEVSFSEYYNGMKNDDDDQDENDFEETKNTIDSLVNSFEAELFQSRREAIRGNLKGVSQNKDKKTNRRKPILSAALQGLMGEANLSFARGQNEMAEKICLEIIRQNPLAAEPFITLAQIYEGKDIEKYLQFSTIAAHLDPTDRDQWIRVAETNVELNNIEQAKNCYSKAIRYHPKDLDLRLRKIQVLEKLKDERRAMYCYYNSFPLIPPEKGKFCLDIAKKVAQYFFKQKKIIQALNSMRYAYNLAPKLFTSEDVNSYLELLILNENYAPVLSTLRDQANLQIAVEQDGDNIIVVACIIPDDMLPDFRTKLCVSLIHLKAIHLLDYLIENILEFIPIENGFEWYIDIAEALIKEECYKECFKLLDPLVQNDEFDVPPYVWLRYADCNRALGYIDQAIKSYYKVVQLAPYCFDARFTLSALLKQQGKHLEAIKALEQDIESETIDPRLLYERCLMLKNVGDIKTYIDVGYLVLLRNSVKLRSREEMFTVALAGSNFRASCIKSIRETRLENPEDIDRPEYIQSNNNVSVEEEYNLFVDLVQTAYKIHEFGTLQKLAFTALASANFRSKFRELQKICIFACLYNNDPQLAFIFFRDAGLKMEHNNVYWNILNMIIQAGDDIKYRRYTKRQFANIPNYALLHILSANYCSYSGSFKYALNEYIPIFRKTNDPLVALSISIALNQMSGQKNMQKRPTTATHAIAFGKRYLDLRMSSVTKQEILYNLGRLHHQLGLLHLAMYYYDEALNLPDTDLVRAHPEYLELKQEIAFNLHLIYKSNGNMEIARKYLYDYIVI